MLPGERLCDFLGQNGVKRAEIDDGRSRGIDDSPDRHFDAIQVAMVGGRPAGGIPVSGVKRDRASQRTLRSPATHHAKQSPKRISGVAVYCDVTPVELTALDWVGVPGCFVGSRLYDGG